MSLYIYHPGTGCLISLTDEVYLVNDKFATEDTMNDLEEGLRIPVNEHKGFRIDNYNMGTLFYGGPQ